MVCLQSSPGPDYDVSPELDLTMTCLQSSEYCTDDETVCMRRVLSFSTIMNHYDCPADGSDMFTLTDGQMETEKGRGGQMEDLHRSGRMLWKV
ncbi:hypothetical protein WMY93_005260 [Mugilogobius chulae]|uniref:GDNF/GAS1 domain-containing protein n=1 Tax=Mugilogobius chulae TaxID=88201 RepID=A0AAW0PT65_9GOBI